MTRRILSNVLAMAMLVGAASIAFCQILGQTTAAGQGIGHYMLTVAIYFVCLGFASLKAHRFVAQSMPAHLTQFYMVDKMGRLLLSAIVFALCLAIFKVAAVIAAVGFILCYLIAMAFEMAYFVQYEKSTKMQTK